MTESATSNFGDYSIAGNVLTYAPNAFYNGDFTVSDLDNNFYDRFRGQLSDGVNLSHSFDVRVVGFRRDTWPAGNVDGLPNSWVATYYGSASGTTADSDTDGDGFDAKTEFLLGTDPTDPQSGFLIDGSELGVGRLSWTSQPYGVYAVESSADLIEWTTERYVTQENEGANMTVDGLPTVDAQGEKRFFRVDRVD